MDDSTPKRSWFERLSSALLREPQDREQLITLLRDAEQKQLLDAEALSMIEGALQVSEMQARDIMIPRPQMVTITKDDNLEQVLAVLTESDHSRYPVMDNDEVDGILLAKDLLPFALNGQDDFEIRNVLRPAMFIPESKRLNSLLKEFRATKNHMAIVIDEYGKVAGVVTLEDVLEQIVGEIEDETDIDDEAYIKAHDDGHYIIKATTPIEEFNEYFETPLNDEGCDTIAGLIAKHVGHVPQRDETIIIDGYHFKVIHADNRRVRVLEVTM
tara:strand:+ start:83507 stop:84319 length:813 start_codon:yes stop_codon:yes gene_type:complete